MWMRVRPLICPECGAQQETSNIRGTWFPCGNCAAHIQIADSWAQRMWWVGAVLSLIVLVALRFAWWISLLAWFPLSVLFGMLIGMALPDPPIESDKPKHRPGSTLGL
jgi:hypothetical protein